MQFAWNVCVRPERVRVYKSSLVSSIFFFFYECVCCLLPILYIVRITITFVGGNAKEPDVDVLIFSKYLLGFAVLCNVWKV